MIDIAVTFEVSVGLMGQMSTVSYAVAVIFGLFMGILSVRFGRKLLLIAGLLFITISALGCFFASNFELMLIFYSLTGVGTAMVFPMATTLVGEHFPLDKRGNAVGWIIAAGSLSYLIGAPTIGFIAGIGGWRFTLLGFVIPISLGSLLLASIGLPRSKPGDKQEIGRGLILESFKEVLSDRSALACLVGHVLRMAAFMAVLIYGVSFFRQGFSVSVDFSSGVVIGAALCYTLGSLAAGRLVNSLGRKTVTVVTTFLAGVITIFFVHLLSLWLSLALFILAAWFFGMASSAANSLSLEQTPRFRGTMMSLNSAAISLGNAVGSALGGLMLVLFDYGVMASTLGVMGIIATLVFFFLTIDVASPSNSAGSEARETG
ncbi:MAG: MFS transporter [Candidatus Bathyarchaeota archaeon]|nr:MAG: MFS transporter [Candidatus Bathyarchaeota archaeon]